MARAQGHIGIRWRSPLDERARFTNARRATDYQNSGMSRPTSRAANHESLSRLLGVSVRLCWAIRLVEAITDLVEFREPYLPCGETQGRISKRIAGQTAEVALDPFELDLLQLAVGVAAGGATQGITVYREGWSVTEEVVEHYRDSDQKPKEHQWEEPAEPARPDRFETMSGEHKSPCLELSPDFTARVFEKTLQFL